MVIIVWGLPGSGKSFFAVRLAKKLNGLYYATDQVRKILFKNPNYTSDEKRSVYNFLLSKISDNSIIVFDGTFYKKDTRELFKNKATEMNQEIRFIEIIADENLNRQRTSKKREESDADYSIYKKIKSQFEIMSEPHLELESKEDNIEEMLIIAMQYIANKNG